MVGTCVVESISTRKENESRDPVSAQAVSLHRDAATAKYCSLSLSLHANTKVLHSMNFCIILFNDQQSPKGLRPSCQTCWPGLPPGPAGNNSVGQSLESSNDSNIVLALSYSDYIHYAR